MNNKITVPTINIINNKRINLINNHKNDKLFFMPTTTQQQITTQPQIIQSTPEYTEIFNDVNSLMPDDDDRALSIEQTDKMMYNNKLKMMTTVPLLKSSDLQDPLISKSEIANFDDIDIPATTLSSAIASSLTTPQISNTSSQYNEINKSSTTDFIKSYIEAFDGIQKKNVRLIFCILLGIILFIVL